MIALATHAAAPPARFDLARVALATLAGGGVDLAYASAVGVAGGRSIASVWQGVAAGWLGRAARDGEWATVALGVLTHFAIAAAMVAAYAAAATRLPVLYRRWPLFAAAYGVLLYGIMYRVVLPLRWPGSGEWRGLPSALDVLAHVGLALAAAFVLTRPRRDA